MSHLVGWKYACIRHKNTQNMKEVQHTSKKFIFIVLCVQLQHGYIKRVRQSVTDKVYSSPKQLLITVYSSPKQSTQTDPVFRRVTHIAILFQKEAAWYSLMHG